MQPKYVAVFTSNLVFNSFPHLDESSHQHPSLNFNRDFPLKALIQLGTKVLY